MIQTTSAVQVGFYPVQIDYLRRRGDKICVDDLTLVNSGWLDILMVLEFASGNSDNQLMLPDSSG
jgi:hypothetical protein